jgi:hypothetical protein
MLGATAFGRKTGAMSACRWGRLPLREFDDLPQQLADKGDTLTALRLFPQRTIDRRNCAPRAFGLGTKVAIGDPVAETNVHDRPHALSVLPI